MNVKLTLEYDGTEFCGWQVQPGQRTVQGAVEEALSSLLRQEVRIHGAGRTDAGVHAMAQVATFSVNTVIPPQRLRFALNPLLPDDVKVVTSEAMPEDFHARYSARAKTYKYHLLFSDKPSPLHRNRAWRVGTKLDLAAVSAGLKLLEGRHDFKAFSSTGSNVTSTERILYQADLSCVENMGVVTLYGNGFLYNMVRIIVGAVAAMGQGKLSADTILTALATGERSLLSATAPAHGLYLFEVHY